MPKTESELKFTHIGRMAYLSQHCYNPKAKETKFNFQIFATSRDPEWLKMIGKDTIAADQILEQAKVAKTELTQNPTEDRVKEMAEHWEKIARENVDASMPEASAENKRSKKSLASVKASIPASKQRLQASMVTSTIAAKKTLKKASESLSSEHFVAYHNLKKKQVVIACKGTNLSANAALGDLQLFFGRVPSRMQEALAFVEHVREKMADLDAGTTLIVTGHSLGGLIAKYITLICAIPSVCFDNPGINLPDFMKQDPENAEHVAERGELTESYMSRPNFINTVGDQDIGQIFLLPQKMPKESDIKKVMKKFGGAAWRHRDIAFDVMAGLLDAVVAALASGLAPTAIVAKFLEPGAKILVGRNKFHNKMSKCEVGQSLAQYGEHLVDLLWETLRVHKISSIRYALTVGKSKEIVQIAEGDWPGLEQILDQKYDFKTWIAQVKQNDAQPRAIVTATM